MNYEAQALQNILTFYHRNYPRDYENIINLLAKKRAQKKALQGLSADTATPAPQDTSIFGWLGDLGKTALQTVANYKLQSYATKQESDIAQQKIKAELAAQQQQAQLAAQQAQSQIAQYQLLAQAKNLQDAIGGSSTLQTALIGVAGLVALWFVYKAVA